MRLAFRTRSVIALVALVVLAALAGGALTLAVSYVRFGNDGNVVIISRSADVAKSNTIKPKPKLAGLTLASTPWTPSPGGLPASRPVVVSNRPRPERLNVALAQLSFGKPRPKNRPTAQPAINASSGWLAMASGDPRFQAWLAGWYKDALAGRKASEGDRVEVAGILKTTLLSCVKLVDIGKATAFYAHDDVTTATIYAAAIQRGDGELSALKPGSAEVRPIVIAMAETKPLLWTVVDGGDQSFVPPLYTLNTDLVDWISPDDKALSNTRIHGQVGVAECPYVMGRTNEAGALAGAIDTTSFTGSQRDSVAWIRALVLFDTRRYLEAIPELTIVASDPSFKYCKDSLPMLVSSLTKLHRPKEAEQWYEKYLARYSVSSDEAIDLACMVESGGG